MKWLPILVSGLLLLSGCHANPKVTILKNIEYGTYPPGQGQRQLLLDLYLPQQATQNPLPTIIYIHGGGWLEYSKENCPGKEVAGHRKVPGL